MPPDEHRVPDTLCDRREREGGDTMRDDFEAVPGRAVSSPPRLAAGIAPADVAPLAANPGQVREVAPARPLGWTADGDRLGHGGGHFDRILAALKPRPVAIGVGFAFARIPTIFPQPHDIPLDHIVTGAGMRSERTMQ